ncbi:hypothetical protein HMPREF9057_01966 [Actinomyces sp. oral taxon 171 str. F0337]|nr:hypothetical protein HMPREF9057_01966 [Actinomyces sp. oral taxon 171 str. F0337]
MLQFLCVTESKAGGRPPREPLARRWATWSAVTGIVVRMRWARSQARSACEE